jgi:hypothetical protein
MNYFLLLHSSSISHFAATYRVVLRFYDHAGIGDFVRGGGNGTWRQGQSPRLQSLTLRRDYHVQSLHKGLVRHSVPFTWRPDLNPHSESQSVPLCTPLQLLRRAAVFARSNAQVSDCFGRDEVIREPVPLETKVYPGRGSDIAMRFSGFRFGTTTAWKKC